MLDAGDPRRPKFVEDDRARSSRTMSPSRLTGARCGHVGPIATWPRLPRGLEAPARCGRRRRPLARDLLSATRPTSRAATTELSAATGWTALVREARVPLGSYNVAFGFDRLVTPSLGEGTVAFLDRDGAL